MEAWEREALKKLVEHAADPGEPGAWIAAAAAAKLAADKTSTATRREQLDELEQGK